MKKDLRYKKQYYFYNKLFYIFILEYQKKLIQIQYGKAWTKFCSRSRGERKTREESNETENQTLIKQ